MAGASPEERRGQRPRLQRRSVDGLMVDVSALYPGASRCTRPLPARVTGHVAAPSAAPFASASIFAKAST